MKLIKRFIIIFSLVFIFLQNALGQDPTFSQFYANPLYLAPSFAGSTEGNRIALNYRDQWPGIGSNPGVYNTYSFSYDRSIPSFNSGIGILATYDAAGSANLSTTNIGAFYSYDFNINQNWHIKPGIQFKFYYLGLDINKLIFNTQIDLSGTSPPVIPPPFNTAAGIDFTTSTIAYNDNIWGGITFDHMFKPKSSFYENGTIIPIKISLFGGWQVFKKTRLKQSHQDIFSITAILQKQGQFYQSDIGAYYYIHPLVLGIWYRGIPFAKVKNTSLQAGDAVIGLIGIKTKQLKIGYSYDFTISNLFINTKGANEVSLIYEFNLLHLLKKSERMKAIPCPEF